MICFDHRREFNISINSVDKKQQKTKVALHPILISLKQKFLRLLIKETIEYKTLFSALFLENFTRKYQKIKNFKVCRKMS